MPINKYHEIDHKRMRDMINVESAMFIPSLDDIFGPDRLVKGDMLQCSYGIPAFPEMRGMHSTLAMAMALDSVKRCHHNDIPIFHMPYEPITFDYDRMEMIIKSIDKSLINLPKPINSFIGDVDDFWYTSVCKYDEEKIKTYKIPSNDRLETLTRIYKLIKGNKK